MRRPFVVPITTLYQHRGRVRSSDARRPPATAELTRPWNFPPEFGGSGAKVGAKVDHSSSGTVPLRRSKTLPIWEPFSVTASVLG